MSDIDWRSIGRGGSLALGKPTLVIAAVSGTLVALLLLSTLSLSGGGAWFVRFLGILLACPVIALIVRRRQVLRRLAVLEETGEHPDNVVHTTTPDGREIEVVVAGAETTAIPRLGVGGLAGWSIASMISGGLSFGLMLIVGFARIL